MQKNLRKEAWNWASRAEDIKRTIKIELEIEREKVAPKEAISTDINWVIWLVYLAFRHLLFTSITHFHCLRPIFTIILFKRWSCLSLPTTDHARWSLATSSTIIIIIALGITTTTTNLGRSTRDWFEDWRRGASLIDGQAKGDKGNSFAYCLQRRTSSTC